MDERHALVGKDVPRAFNKLHCGDDRSRPVNDPLVRIIAAQDVLGTGEDVGQVSARYAVLTRFAVQEDRAGFRVRLK